MNKAQLFFSGDRVRMRYAGQWQRGSVSVVFEAKTLAGTRYRIVFDGGGCCDSANPFEMEPLGPLELLAECAEKPQ
jgi:hypothetical protein